MNNIVGNIDKLSIAEKKGIEIGDELVSINFEPIEDYIDYAYFMGEKKLLLEIKKKNGRKKVVRIKKEEGMDIGITFCDNGLEGKKHCRNRCLFCFVDQLPPHMRETLCFKDDDWRLSFLMGNYITFTNTDINDLTRIIKRKVSPLYVSVHATDDDVREKMLTNKFARGIMPLLDMLVKKGIKIHTQIVLCPGINDNDILQKSILDLYSLYPGIASLAVVPVGLTAHREKLYKLRPVDKKDAQSAIDMIEDFQKWSLKKNGERFVFAADEMYIKAERELPKFDEYEDFPQIENGVGLVASYKDEIESAYDDFETAKYKHISIATGVDFYPFMKEIAKKTEFIYNINIDVHKIENDFFGRSITVAGLLTGRDIIAALKGKELGEKLFLPREMFKQFEKVTLDNINLEELSKEIGTQCEIADSDGYEFIKALCMEDK